MIYLPGFLFLDLSQELLVGDGLVQLPAPRCGHLLQLLPDVVQLTKAVVYFRASELGRVDQGLSGVLNGLQNKLRKINFESYPVLYIGDLM